MEQNRKITGRRRAALVFLIAGVLLLCLDFPRRTDIAYPDYVFAEHYGPDTQRMILEDVVGTHLTVDIASELCGYLFLSLSLLIVYFYARPAAKEEKRKVSIRFGWPIPKAKIRHILLAAAGADVYIAAKVLPFFTNGIYRFGPEWFLNFGLAFFTAAATLFAVLCFLRECDRYQNHKSTQFIYLFVILTVFTGVMKDLAAFLGLGGVRTAYAIANTAAALVMCIALIRYVRTEEIVEAQNAAEDEFDLYGIGKPKDDGESVIYFKS